MAPVRVTRILEYIYVDAEEALRDMERWSVPPLGSITYNARMVVRSAVIGPVFGESWELDIDAKETPSPGAP
jgi:hypothetical protein